MKNDDSVAHEVVNRYLELLRCAKETYRDLGDDVAAGRDMDQWDVRCYVGLLGQRWFAVIKFLAAELGIETQSAVLPDLPKVPLPGMLAGLQPMTLDELHQNDAAADAVITPVYETVLDGLKRIGFDVEDMYLQDHIEAFADRVWGWVEDGGKRFPAAS